MSKKIAFFDMDHTLTANETLLPWLIEIKGVAKTYITAVIAAFLHLFIGFPDDRRTRYKKLWLRMLLKGVKKEDAIAAAYRLYPRLKWLKEQTDALEEHLENGDEVVVATGAATLLAAILVEKRFGRAITVIGTELEILDDGKFSGRLISDNCVRAAKAVAVKAYMDKNGPYEESWGYGNPPHDEPMIDLLDHGRLV